VKVKTRKRLSLPPQYVYDIKKKLIGDNHCKDTVRCLETTTTFKLQLQPSIGCFFVIPWGHHIIIGKSHEQKTLHCSLSFVSHFIKRLCIGLVPSGFKKGVKAKMERGIYGVSLKETARIQNGRRFLFPKGMIQEFHAWKWDDAKGMNYKFRQWKMVRKSGPEETNTYRKDRHGEKRSRKKHCFGFNSTWPVQNCSYYGPGRDLIFQSTQDGWVRGRFRRKYFRKFPIISAHPVWSLEKEAQFPIHKKQCSATPLSN